VDPEGFEPSAFSMPLRRAPNCAMGPQKYALVAMRRVFYPEKTVPSTNPLTGHKACTPTIGFNSQVNPGSGPEGIRTPGLLSAIEARSQLRYRPKCEEIVSEALGNVKQGVWDGR
jgi:hypothetical protein